MARLSLKNLFIPRKTQDPVAQPNYQVDQQTIEIWAKAVLDYLQNNGILEITSTGGTVTITDPFGPVTNLEAAGGGGGGVTDITSPDGSITILNATGPTVSIDILDYPFLGSTGGFADGRQNTGYGSGVFAGFVGLATPSNNTAIGYGCLANLGSSDTGSENTAIGHNVLNVLTSGGNNTGVGRGALINATGSNNTAVGNNAGGPTLTSGGSNTFIGNGSGGSVSTGSYNTALGHGTGPASDLSGTVALGVDSSNFAASPTHNNDFNLGTDLHVINFLNIHTGSNTMDLGTNSPATGPHPTGWIKIRDNGGSIGYIPYWV